MKVAEQTFNGYTEEAIDSPQANADGHVARATETTARPTRLSRAINPEFSRMSGGTRAPGSYRTSRVKAGLAHPLLAMVGRAIERDKRAVLGVAAGDLGERGAGPGDA